MDGIVALAMASLEAIRGSSQPSGCWCKTNKNIKSADVRIGGYFRGMESRRMRFFVLPIMLELMYTLRIARLLRLQIIHPQLYSVNG